MRKIIFRAWDKRIEKMYPVVGIDFLDEWVRMYSKMAGRHYSYLDDLVLMQFTGLEDKNGENIYEGDILLLQNEKLGKIFWNNFCASFCVAFNKATPEDLDISLAKNSEVVGNVYENKELLNE